MAVPEIERPISFPDCDNDSIEQQLSESLAENDDILTITPHAEQRRARRNLSIQDIHYVMDNGTSLLKTGVEFVFLRKKDIPVNDQADNRLRRLEGTVLLFGNDGTIVTCYRNRRALSDIQRKNDYHR